MASKNMSALMNEAKLSPGGNATYEAPGTAVRESPTDPVDERDMEPEPKTRQCLLCRTPFPSAWAGERICRPCKSTAAWRNGVVRS